MRALDGLLANTSLANYKTLEAAQRRGVEIEEIGAGAETHSGYDAIAVIGHGTEATLQLGADGARTGN